MCTPLELYTVRKERPVVTSKAACDSLHQGDEVAELLRRCGFSAAAYHAGMKPVDRASALRDWQRGKTRIVVVCILRVVCISHGSRYGCVPVTAVVLYFVKQIYVASGHCGFWNGYSVL